MIWVWLLLAMDPRVLAHRGGAGHWPENTLEAMDQALAAGVKVLETDAVLTGDGRVVLSHDLTVKGMVIGERRFAELGRPALEELLKRLRGTEVQLMLETKVTPGEPAPERIVAAIDRLLREAGVSRQVILQSFDHRTLREMRRRNPEVRLCPLNPRTRLKDYVAAAQELGAEYQLINFRLIEKRDVEALHAAGIRVYSGTTSEPAEWRRLLGMGVDGILTDHPLELGRLIEEGGY